MQEVFENIIKALEEKRDEAEKNMELSDVLSEVNSYGGMFDALDRAIEIVKQEAEQYNNGWIPVSERMPDVCGYPVLLTVENAFGQRSVCKSFTNYMKEGELLFYTNEKEYCQQLTSSILSESWKPIAWMNLTTPYQPKGE